VFLLQRTMPLRCRGGMEVKLPLSQAWILYGGKLTANAGCFPTKEKEGELAPALSETWTR
jgi:hypothetical protein